MEKPSKAANRRSPAPAWAVAFGLVVGWVGWGGAQAATIVAVPEAALTRLADAIVFGSILSTRVETNERKQVFTVARFQVYRSVHGAKAGDILSLRVPGGRLPGGWVADSAGSPTLTSGQMFFGFLEAHPDGYRPLGLSYGLLQVRRSVDGTFRVFRDLQGLALANADGSAASPVTYELQDVPLEKLIARLQTYLGRANQLEPPGASTSPSSGVRWHGPGASRP